MATDTFSSLAENCPAWAWKHPRVIIASALGGPLVLAAILIFYNVAIAPLFFRPPSQLTSARLLNPIVVAGGDLRFEIRAIGDEGRSCAGSITREFSRLVVEDGVVMSEKHRTIQGGVPIVTDGESRFIVVVPLPPSLPPGDWAFQSETTYDCGILSGIRRYRTPRMDFRVRSN